MLSHHTLIKKLEYLAYNRRDGFIILDIVQSIELLITQQHEPMQDLRSKRSQERADHQRLQRLHGTLRILKVATA
jgi:hypothetical protein